MIAPTDLFDRWEQELVVLDACGCAEAAATRRRDLEELREWWRERQLDELTVEQAAAYSGLAPGTIGNRLRDGSLRNAGTKGRPRVRRCDLPARAPGSPNRDPAAVDLADKIMLQTGSPKRNRPKRPK